MEQNIAEKIVKAGNNKEKLIRLLNYLDVQKRELRNSLRTFSNESYGSSGLAGRKRFIKIRKMKEELNYLIGSREDVSRKIGSINKEKKKFNEYLNQKNSRYLAAFVAAAELFLSEEKFIEIELKALEMLQIQKD